MNKYRTHNCNELRKEDVDKKISLSGWINKKRDHGNLLFIDLRDNYGITQCIIDKDNKYFSDLEKMQLETVIKVEGKVVNVHPGPIITLFEILPAEGVRVNKFVQLSDDIARVMEAQSVRVLARIPGSNHVGVEIPNVNPQTIYLKNVINSEKYLKSKAKLKLAIGKGTLGDISILDLVEMPHLLIAGTTGSGKSVSLNTIIVSLLYQLKPEEVKFVIIDPKKVEMSLYRGLESLLIKI